MTKDTEVKKKKIVIENRKPAWCYRCDNFAWIYNDRSCECWTCSIVERSCDCQQYIKRIKITPYPSR